jgi:replicative DNA helicase
MTPSNSLELQKGMPSSLDSERFVLGSILLDDSRFVDVAGRLTNADFTTEANRRIYTRMTDLHQRGEKIDRVTVANELHRHGELESVNGLTYIISLDEGLPRVVSIDSYVAIVRDKAVLRRLVVAGQQLMNRALTAEDSPDDILAGAEETLLGIGAGRMEENDGLVSAGDFLRGFPGGFNAFASPSTRENGLRTGLTKFDEMTGGLHAGELIILAARPGVGKSAAALGMAWSIATRYNAPVAIFSLEMSRESLLLRLLCSSARIDSQRLRAGYLNQEERTKIRDARERMLEAPIFIDDTSNLGLMELHAKIRRWEQVNKRKLALVVVDYLQLMASHGKAENENAQITKITRGLKLLAKEMGIPFLVLSQLSRASENRTGDKRPQLSDLRSSGSIEQDSDVVALLYRPELHKPDREDLRGVAELIVAKSRSGPLGITSLAFIHSMTKFENLAEDQAAPEGDGRLPYAD